MKIEDLVMSPDSIELEKRETRINKLDSGIQLLEWSVFLVYGSQWNDFGLL